MKNKTAVQLHELELHEELEITETCYAMRVIGGWIYKHYTSKDDEEHEYYELVTTTFVPWNNEMQ
jgi:hypothetical protein